ncbi:ABC transporter ATP-binding protein [Actinomyces viscosus]|uniref:ABC transporter ATP-binding protein n=1 Tax=Actinomyces viscosus TaxID=1656 RepID=UPI000F83942A|nr:ABC transporter ATP-binding protein [Actinomyces viscosus]
MSIAPPTTSLTSPLSATTPAPPTVSFPEPDIAAGSPVASPVTNPVGSPATAPVAHPAGAVYGLLGPTGAGKSTVLKLLLGAVRPTSGSISALGHQVTPHHGLPPGTIGSRIEGPSYYPSLTGRENLAMMASHLGLPSRRVEHALAAAGLTGQENLRVRRYAAEMKQRLALAMALPTDPPLMLLDEPTKGLGPAAAEQIRQIIVTLARQEGRTIIVSSQVLSEIEQIADTVGIISAGGLRYQGPLSGLDSDGVIEMTVSAPTAVSTLLTFLGIAHEVRRGRCAPPGTGRTARLPTGGTGQPLPFCAPCRPCPATCSTGPIRPTSRPRASPGMPSGLIPRCCSPCGLPLALGGFAAQLAADEGQPSGGDRDRGQAAPWAAGRGRHHRDPRPDHCDHRARRRLRSDGPGRLPAAVRCRGTGDVGHSDLRHLAGVSS